MNGPNRPDPRSTPKGRGAADYQRLQLDRVSDVPLFALLSRGPEAMPVLRVLLQRGLSPAGAGGLTRFLSASLHGRDLEGLVRVICWTSDKLDISREGRGDPAGAAPH